MEVKSARDILETKMEADIILGTNGYTTMTQIRYFNRYTGQMETEHPPAGRLMRWIYGTHIGRTLLPVIRRKALTSWYGGRMDRRASKERIAKFVADLGIDMSESQKSIDEFATFNDFFYRKLKPESRPIRDGFVSPGDGRLLGFDSVADVGDFFVKGSKFSLDRFLGDASLAEKYSDGILWILRLAPNDYHRYHFPIAGTPSEMKEIDGTYYSVSPIALAWDFARVFCENKRAYCTLKTRDFGDVLLAPVGATMVGSIVSTYDPNAIVAKGDEMGYFAFGGSTIVILMERGTVQIDEDILQHTAEGIECYVKMGDRIGR